MSMNTGELPDNEIKQRGPNNISKRERFLTSLFVLVLLISAVAGYFYLRKAENKIAENSANYFTNDHEVLCSQPVRKYLQCENVVTGELKMFIVPEQLREFSTIIQSPNRERMLIADYDGRVVVTDRSFQNAQEVIVLPDLANSTRDLTWIGSDYIAYKEIKDYKYESEAGKVAEAGLESVLMLVNIESSEKSELYKTRETTSNSFKILGGNSQYVFLGSDIPYNWAAKEAQSSPGMLLAVRRSDGYVRTINSHQIDYNDDYSQIVVGTNYEAAYGSEDNNLFYFVGQSATDSSAYLRIGQLEEKEYGMQLSRKGNFNTGELKLNNSSLPIMTSEGILTGNVYYEYPYVLVKDNGEAKTLNLSNSYGALLTYKKMPQMEQADSDRPEISDYVTAQDDTPPAILEFLESLVTKDVKENEFNSVILLDRLDESQLEVGWRAHGVSYFILKDGKYEEVLTSIHGLSCEQRDAAGVNPLLANCIKPGEGL